MLRAVNLICSRNNERAERCASRAADFFRARNITAHMLKGDEAGEAADLVVTFGGDGTLLSGARLALRIDAPLLGINLGTVGFLTEEAPERLEEALEAVVAGQYQIEERRLLHVTLPRTGETFDALNDG